MSVEVNDIQFSDHALGFGRSLRVVAGTGINISISNDADNPNTRILLIENLNPDMPNLDAFGRLRVSDTGNRFDSEFTFDTLEEVIDVVLGGGGTVTHKTNSRDVVCEIATTDVTDFSGLHSYPIPYTPGNSQLIELTGVLDHSAVGSGTAQIFLRSKITGSVVEQVVDQASWNFPNNDLDFTTSQIFVMDFQSLKVGNIRYGLNRGGVFELVHSIANDNVRESGYWQTPSQPIYWRIYNDSTYTYMEVGYGDTSNAIGFRYRVAKTIAAQLCAICATVKSEGGAELFSMKGYPQSADMGTTTKTIGAVILPLISIRVRTTFNSLDNNAISIPSSLSVQTDNPIRLVVYHDTTLSGAAWTNVDTSHSVMEYDITASSFSGGHIIDSEYVATSKNINAAFNTLLGKAVLWSRKNGNSGIFTIAAVRTTSTSASVLCGIKWQELR